MPTRWCCVPPTRVDLLELICGEFLAQAVPDKQFRLDGPEIRIGREATAALALAFHELTMNALTHGALDRNRGTIEVCWNTDSHDGEACLHLLWREYGVGLRELSPRHRGFGTELLERMLPYELSARPQIEYTPEGAHVELHIPARAEATIWRTTSPR